jgi:hypothetical protein
MYSGAGSVVQEDISEESDFRCKVGLSNLLIPSKIYTEYRGEVVFLLYMQEIQVGILA